MWWHDRHGSGFERKREQERERLLGRMGGGGPTGPGGEARVEVVEELRVGAEAAAGHGAASVVLSQTAQLGDRTDDFTPLLVEYYAYGLAQARSSFVISQRFAGIGAAILLLGVALAVWKAESGGDQYLGVVTSAVGVVVTLVGQLFHRRADLALRHMSEQAAALREDRRAAESVQLAVDLLTDVRDPELRGRLQAGLILKLSGAELPAPAPARPGP
ncbi:TRADD-N-associated membrane domain-containing protein [Streptomyces sp. BI20]|uniref:TRADD-N-associated membrane domain-containing protein n=1 Tax=Streptomyces sp. BI20 TaxID=3403460 RepID=UPI003C770722